MALNTQPFFTPPLSAHQHIGESRRERRRWNRRPQFHPSRVCGPYISATETIADSIICSHQVIVWPIRASKFALHRIWGSRRMVNIYDALMTMGEDGSSPIAIHTATASHRCMGWSLVVVAKLGRRRCASDEHYICTNTTSITMRKYSSHAPSPTSRWKDRMTTCLDTSSNHKLSLPPWYILLLPSWI